jgi:uncharacterized protein YecE (DUF72 family)
VRADVLVGCCGFPEAQARYVQEFRAVEIQQTFYDPPRPATAGRWRAAAGPAFHFAIKAWQAITHDPSSPTYRRLRRPIDPDARARYGSFRPTIEVDSAWGRTTEVARALRADVVLLQCPASFTPTSEHVGNLRGFLERVDRGGATIAWEPRGAWPDPLVAALCRDLALVHAVDPFSARPLTDGLKYFRLHGIGGPRHRYHDDELARLADLVERGPAWVLFNNVHMLEDARRFGRLVTGG